MPFMWIIHLWSANSIRVENPNGDGQNGKNGLNPNLIVCGKSDENLFRIGLCVETSSTENASECSVFFSVKIVMPLKRCNKRLNVATRGNQFNPIARILSE